MLYKDFKKMYDVSDSVYNDHIEIEDARTQPIKDTPKQNVKKSKKRGVFIALFIVLSIVFACLLYVEVFIDGGIAGLFKKISKEDPSVIYLVVEKCENKNDAVTLSDNVRAKGGAGYLYFNGDLFVVVAYFKDDTSAEKVAEKNGYDYISVFLDNQINDFDISKRSAVEKVLTANDKVINSLNELANEYQLNDVSISDSIKNIIDTYEKETKDFSDKANESDLKEMQLLSKIKCFNKTLRSLSVDNLSKASLLSELRYASVALVLM